MISNLSLSYFRTCIPKGKRLKISVSSRFLLFSSLFFLAFNCSNFYAQKNDTIYLLNGDKITGEIKRFEYGILFLSTDAMLMVNIPFDRINTIYSNKLYELVTNSGIKYFGYIGKSSTKASINIILPNEVLEKPIWDIVNIAYLKNKFIQRTDGSINLGLSYTKASNVLQYSIGGYAIHRIKYYATRIDLSTIRTNENNGNITKNNDYSLSLTRYLPRKWFIKLQEKFQQNTELDLLYRFQSALGPGYDIIRTNKNRLYGLIGISHNLEETIQTDQNSNNIEGIVSLQYRWIQYRHPKIDVTSGLNYFPSMTVQNRFRLEFNLNAKFEIITDMFFNIEFYDKFDSKNISDGKAKNDYGIITSIGYMF